MKTWLGILRDLDVDAAIAKAVANGASAIVPTVREATLAGLHKARMHHPDMTQAEREVSRAWLRDNGYSERVATVAEWLAARTARPQ